KLIPGTSYHDSGLVNGTTYYYTVTALDEAGNESLVAPVISVVPAGGAGIHQEDDLGIVYSSGWTRTYENNSSGNYYSWTNTVDATASFIFDGTGIKWIGLPSANGGYAEVYLDGSLVNTVNLYRSQPEYQAVLWQSGVLEAGIHELVIKSLDTKQVNIDYLDVIQSSDTTPPSAPTGFNVGSEGTSRYLQWEQSPEEDLYGYYVYRSLTGQADSFSRVNVDPIRYGTTYREEFSDSPVYYKITAIDTVGNESPASAIVSDTPLGTSNALVEEDNLAIEYRGIWTPSASSNASGGNFTSTTDAGSTFKYTWYGTGLDWLAKKDSNLGIAKVILDNGQPVLVDLYNGSALYMQPVYRIRDLALGMHTLEITYFGRNIKTNGTGINVDAFNIVDANTGLPVPPSNVVANALVNKVKLTWDAPDPTQYPDIIGYNVYYQFGVYADQKANSGLVQSGFTHTGLSLSTVYYYKITAVDALGNESLVSEEVSAETAESYIKAVLEPAYSGVRGQPISLDGKNSYTADPPLIYAWDLDNDGSYDDATGEQTSVVFDNAGEYTIGLQVTDANDRISTTTAAVNVRVAVTGVNLDKETLTLEAGKTGSLTAAVLPEDAPDKTVTWSSSNPAVATVNSNGEVTGVNLGTAIISVKTTDGSYTASCTVTVIKPIVKVTGVSLNQSSLRLNVHHTAQLTATVAPTDADNKGVTWSSSDEDVATVDQTGLVTAVSAGTAEITVTTSDQGFTATCQVTSVADTTAPTIQSVSPENAITLGGAQAQRLTVRAEDNEGSAGATARMEYSRDGQTWTLIPGTVIGPNGTSPFSFYIDWDLSTMTSGTYTLRYTVVDGAENSVQQTVTYQIDRTAPQAPQNLTATASPGSINLSWTMPADADVEYYRLYRAVAGGSFQFLQKISGRTNVSCTDLTGAEGQEYQYQITAVDKFSQEGSPSNVATSTGVSDTVPPTILGIEQLDGTVFGKQATITVRAEDNIKLASVKLQYSLNDLDWTDIGRISDQTTATFHWNTESLNGEVKVRALAYDAAGNESDGNPVRTYQIDGVGPAQITGVTPVAAVTSVLLNWDDVPDLDFHYFQVEVKDTFDGIFASKGKVYDKRGLNVTGLKASTDYWFRVVAYDKVGNRGIPSEEIQVKTLDDAVAPQVTGISPAPAQFANLIALRGTAADNVGVAEFTFQYSTDRLVWTDLATIHLANSPASASAAYDWDVSGLAEGAYFVRGVAKDTAGNLSSTSDNANYVEYRVDHTGPTAPTGFQAQAADGYVTLSWLQNPELDLVAYKVYKSTSVEGSYSVLAERVSSLEYRDRNVEPQTTYFYRVAALDRSGNEGQWAEVSVATSDDTTVPDVLSVSPSDNAALPANPVISVLTSDNYRLAKVTLDYQMVGDTSGPWTLIGEKDLNTYSEVSRFTWTTTGLTEGQYLVRVIATDQAGNVSAARVTQYTLNLQAPVQPVLTVTPRGWGVDLSWSANSEPDFAGYRLYRSTVSGGSYQRIRETTLTSYTDTPLLPGITYYYKVEALDTYRNSVMSEEIAAAPNADDPYPPTAAAGNDQSAIIGMEISFDGTLSRDNDRIASYEWDFGDGSAKAAIAQPTHTYLEAGTYTVTLSVSDPTGNISSDTLQITVKEPLQVGTLDVRVIDDSSGVTLSGASVVIQLPDGSLEHATTNSQGIATIVGSAGEYKVYAYKTDFKPVAIDATLENSQKTTATVRLQRGELVVGELTVRRMTLDEVKATGVDVNAPENQWVYSYEVHLSFNNQPLEPVVHIINGQGQFIGSSWQPLVIHNPPNPQGTNPGTMIAYPTAVPNYGHPEVRPTIAYLVVPGEARWLKEFFEVGLTLENTADEEFVISDSKSTLKLPNGLVLAPTREPQSLTVNLGDIAGGERRETKWIIRGDEKGWYNLEADFTGMLQPFDDQVNAVFKTKDPFRVWGDDALRMRIDAQNSVDQGYPYNVRFGLENVSDIPVYNAAIELKDQGKQHYIYAPNQELTETINELSPGETVWADYQLIPSINGFLDLSQSYILKTGGNSAVQSEITGHDVPENLPGTAPVLQQIHTSDGKVTLTWTPVSGALKYRIYYVRDDLAISRLPEMVYEAQDSETTVTLAETNGAKDYVLTTVIPEGEVLYHATTGLSWTAKAGAMVITVNPDEIYAGVERELWITVNKEGLPVAGGTVDVGSYAQGVILDSNGQAKIKVRPTSPGIIVVTAHDPVNSQITVSTNVTVLGALLAAPVVQPVFYTDSVVNGTAKPYTRIIVKKGSAEIGNGFVGGDGTFAVGISAQAVGTVLTVIATDTLGNISPETTVTVGEQNIPVEGVSLSKASTTITVGETEILTATVEPNNASNKAVNWSSSDESVATISPSGMVTGVSEGTAEIRVTTVDGGFSDICTVTILKESVIKPLVRLGVNPRLNNTVGLFVGIGDIMDESGNPISNPILKGYQIGLEFNQEKLDVLDVIEETNLGSFTQTNDPEGNIILTDSSDIGTSDFESLFFVPIQLKGSVLEEASIRIRLIDITEETINSVATDTSVTLYFQRGEIRNEFAEDPGIEDALAGLQYLANIRKAGPGGTEVNLVNLASIYAQEGTDQGIKANIKDIITLMQYVVGNRNEYLVPSE
ncbi:MAG: Ig-like domain-containing protein, partial [Desulfosporosinus sp.]|nr:Ig-like domain-containing protein [Desulfosporosinus sp.]